MTRPSVSPHSTRRRRDSPQPEHDRPVVLDPVDLFGQRLEGRGRGLQRGPRPRQELTKLLLRQRGRILELGALLLPARLPDEIGEEGLDDLRVDRKAGVPFVTNPDDQGLSDDSFPPTCDSARAIGSSWTQASTTTVGNRLLERALRLGPGGTASWDHGRSEALRPLPTTATRGQLRSRRDGSSALRPVLRSGRQDRSDDNCSPDQCPRRSSSKSAHPVPPQSAARGM